MTNVRAGAIAARRAAQLHRAVVNDERLPGPETPAPSSSFRAILERVDWTTARLVDRWPFGLQVLVATVSAGVALVIFLVLSAGRLLLAGLALAFRIAARLAARPSSRPKAKRPAPKRRRHSFRLPTL